jgi:preprotein translocase subunit SecD
VKLDVASAEQRQGVMEQTRQILERRINAYGLSEAMVQPYANRGNELLVQLPGVSDASRIRNLIQSRAVLEWYSVEGGPYTSQAEAMAQLSGILPVNGKLLPTRQGSDGQRSCYLVARPSVIRGTDLRDARTAATTMEQPVTYQPIESILLNAIQNEIRETVPAITTI